MRQRVCVALAALVIVAAGVAGADPVQIVDDIPGAFIDIAATGELLPIGDEGEALITTDIGNGLLPAGNVVVANNGGIAFNPPDMDLAPGNENLPSQGAFGGGQALMPYWDDIGNDVGGVYYQALDDRLIVQWENRFIGTSENGEAGFITFQVQVFDRSEAGNPYFQFIYEDMAAAGYGASATIGYQDGGAGFNDDVWSLNTPGAIADGVVLTALPEPGSVGLLAVALLARRRR